MKELPQPKVKKKNIYFPGLLTSHITISRIKLNVLMAHIKMAHIKIAVYLCIDVSVTSFNKPGKFRGTLFHTIFATEFYFTYFKKLL